MCRSRPGTLEPHSPGHTGKNPMFTSEQTKRTFQIIASFPAFLSVWTWTFSYFGRFFLSTFLPEPLMLPGKNFLKQNLPIPFVSWAIWRITVVQSPCCVCYITKHTQKLSASFQVVPCETLVLGSVLIRGIRHRNAPFSGIERIGGICKLHVQNAGVYLHKSLTVGKEPSWDVQNGQEAAVSWGRKEEGAGKPPVSPVLYSTGADYEAQSFKRQEAKNLLPHCVSVPQRTVTLWSQEALDCSFEKRQLAGYSMSNK